MKKINYFALVHKQITGELSPEELVLLKDWLVEDDQHSVLADQIRGIWIASNTKSSGWEPDVEGGLQKLRRRMEEEEKISINQRPVIFTLMKFAAAALLLFSAGYFISNFNLNNSGQEWKIAETAGNETKVLNLEDGSTVTLNEATYFSFPAEFTSGERMVKMDGEGFFQITKDAARPFSIEMDHGTVRVLGTSFNITNNDEANTTTISVATGKVAFIPKGSKQEFILEQNDKLVYNANTKQYRQLKDLSPNDWSWKTKGLIFKDTKLEEVIPAIEKHFDIKLFLNNQELATCRNLTAIFTEAGKQEVLSALSLTVGGNFKETKEKDSFVLYGGVCE